MNKIVLAAFALLTCASLMLSGCGKDMKRDINQAAREFDKAMS